ncbi:arylamine N-acetyltransferase [Nocardiopsis flavescens]|uniref:N-hydroxyarylamine O-acetyltransferase n=1 Tax=Nocardiopsis flavescens TaxID=758803 RepID=A0A1M6E6H1_9ACTN|nr:arylamine N-acetyltransferase [Nocardiopsis flavescens]SHI81096.1 N-hydroxyarylamine O-acetyltransferase [Nocardiopsis flavescens]
MTFETHALPAAAAPGPLFTEADPWSAAELDLDAYLARTGLAGDLPPTAPTLRAVQRAHLAAIPFENVELVLERPLPLDVPALVDKMVRRRRGGYCYEQNLLLAAVLSRLGFSVTGLAARVLVGAQGHLRPATHALLRVETEQGPHLADVGFGGGGLLEPIPFEDGRQEVQGGWGVRLDRAPGLGGPEWLLRSFTDGEWEPQYAFTTAGQARADYAIFSHYLASHPRSPFRGRLTAQRIGPGVRHRLADATLVTDRTDGTAERRELAAEEVPGVLDGVFGIGLDAREQEIVVRRVSAFLNM